MVFRSRSKSRRSNGKLTERKKRVRRDGRDRLPEDREDEDDRLHMTDLYKTDLDRHLWSWPKSERRKKKKKRRRKLARILASAVGMAGAAGVSYWAYKRLSKDGFDAEDDPMAAQAADEGDDDV